jgi:two-component system phosphate regulon sensor histidine kinase PhoR
MATRLFWKLELTYAVLLLAVLLAADSYGARTLRHNAIENGYRHLESLSRLALADFPSDASRYAEWARKLAESGARVTLVRTDGEVLADSSEDPARMENHGGRPEIRRAFEAGTGRETRWSATVRRDLVYFAVTTRTAGGEMLALRLATPLAEVDMELARLRVRLWAGSGIALLLGIAVSLAVSKRISGRVQRLREFAQRVAGGDFSHLPAEREGDELTLLAHSLNATAKRLGEMLGELRSERNRAEAILRSMVEAVAVVGAEERLVFANRAFCQMLDLDAPPSAGKALVELVREPELLKVFRRALGENRVVEAEIKLTQAGGARGEHFSVVASPLEAGGTSGAVLVMHDISELRRLERVRRDFVANVSHELRTPLTAIQGFAETLLGGALADQNNNARFVEIIRTHAARLNRLTEDLLKLSAIEGRRQEPEWREVNVRSLIESCVETVEYEARSKDLKLEVDCPPETPAARGDAMELREALQNILDNAVRYTPVRGSVSVTARALDGRVSISVADTGIGIPQAEQERIFERFYRVDPARSRELGGTGLGLSIARHIIEAHGGRIEVESELGRGSTFRIILPAA